MSISCRFQSILLSFLLLFILYQCSDASLSNNDNDVVVKDLRLFYGGNEFFVKGVSYSPEPIGQQSMKLDGSGGTGFCSPRREADGLTRSACYYDHYYDGQVHPQGPSNKPYWKDVWERDFKVMNELGFNTVRVYHMSSFTKTLYNLHGTSFPMEFADPSFAEDNRPFMDTLAQYNMKGIIPVASEENILKKYSNEDLKRLVEARVEEVGNHDALLMWAVGNELNLYKRPEMAEKVNFVMEYVKQYTKQRWNREVPVTTAVIDLPKSYYTLAEKLKVDIFTTNSGYRDVALETLWKPDLNNAFAGWECLSKKYRIPILIGEFGMHNADRVTQEKPDWVNQQWKDIVDARKKGCIGGIFFEFSDEPLKDPGQRDMGLVKYEINTDSATGKTSNDLRVFLPDKLVKKDTIFEAAKSGLSDSPYRAYNLNADVYVLTGQKQMKISEVPQDDREQSLKIECKAPNKTINVDVECPTGLKNCNGACYNPSKYHCKNGQLQEGAEQDSPNPNPTPTPTPTPTPNPNPNPTPTPDPNPTPDPTPTPNPDPTPDPKPTPDPENSDVKPLDSNVDIGGGTGDDDDDDDASDGSTNGSISNRVGNNMITQCMMGVLVIMFIMNIFV